jgi:anion-transporting  ArsA/GET3 family ATPase
MAFADLVGSGWVKLVGRTYQFVARTGMMSLGRRSLDLYARVESLLGANLVRQILDFYSIFVSIAEGYANRAEKTVALLKDPSVTEFRVVTTPQKALRDARFFSAALKERGFPLGTVYVNRMWPHDAAEAVRSTGVSGLEAEVLAWYASVRQSHLRALEQLRREYSGQPIQIAPLAELERDVDGLGALERIAAQLGASQ